MLSLLWCIFSLSLGTLVCADYQIDVQNLPLAQHFEEPFALTLSISAYFPSEEKEVILTVDECGTPLATLPLTLIPNITHDISVIIEKESPESCILTFKLLDTDQTLLTSKQIWFVPQCPSQRPIDRGLDYSLLLEEELVTETPESSNSITTTIKPQIVKENSASQEMLTYTSTELNAAFELLVEKGILSPSDQERLQTPLTRIEAAEMFVKIALANDLPRDEDKSCNFPDMKKESKNDIAIATLACQFNIMGVHPDYTQLDNFMPSMIIPSEQLITAFSRLMWGDLYEQSEKSDEYYVLHFNIMHSLKLVNYKVVYADQTLADFVIIAARALHKGQLVIKEPLSEITPTEKKRFWFW